jgi:MscS family membrane protein
MKTFAMTMSWIGVLISLITAAPGMSQEATPVSGPPPTPAAVGPEDAYNRGAPRTTVQGFLDACQAGDYTRGAEYLDLRGLRKARRATQGRTLAHELCIAWERALWVNLDLLSADPEGDTADGLPARREAVGSIKIATRTVPIRLERIARDDGTPIWKISAATVEAIPDLYEEFGYGVLGDYLPAALFEIRFLQIRLWQWVALASLLLVAYGGAWVLTRTAVRIGRTIVARTRTTLDDKLLRAGVGPLRLTLWVLIVYAGTFALALSVRAQTVVVGLNSLLFIAATTWLLLRTIDVLSWVVEERFVARPHVALSLVPLARRSAKIFIATLAFIGVLQNLGFNVTSLLAGLGIGGLAVALAAQKTVEHLFGGITLVTDQPVRVGDFCRFGDRIGTVEDIGLRSTRVRTLDRTIVSVPNGEFSGMQIENFSKRDRMWLRHTIGLRYETTPDQLRYVLVELKKLLLAHPKVHPDPARVRFIGFGAYSLDLEIFAYVLTADINEFLAIQEDMLLRIMDIVQASGAGFAFPSQTVYTAADAGLDGQKRHAAEAQVRAWRATHSLWLPTVPADQVAALDDTLDYPPMGSAARARQVG